MGRHSLASNGGVKNIKVLIEENKLEDAINQLVHYAKINEIEQLVTTYIWSKDHLQDFIRDESRGEFMHWSSTYDMVANVKTVKDSWFYRDDKGLFYNINESHVEETLLKIESNCQGI